MKRVLGYDYYSYNYIATLVQHIADIVHDLCSGVLNLVFCMLSVHDLQPLPRNLYDIGKAAKMLMRQLLWQ